MSEKQKPLLSIAERDNYDLFKDEGIRAIVDAIPEEQRRAGKRHGEYIYSTDYDKKTGASEKCIDDLTFICEGMKSGLRPSQLDVEEIELIRRVKGARWFEAYGYSSESD